MLKAKYQTRKLARWATVISGLNLDIRYRPGRKNANAHGLSRLLIETAVDDPGVGADAMQVSSNS